MFFQILDRRLFETLLADGTSGIFTCIRLDF
jgi:hypothetical protein